MKQIAIASFVVTASVTGQTFYKDLVLRGPAANELFATSLTSPGDLDGDRYPDLIVGSPGTPHPMAPAGSVYIYSGRTKGLIHIIRSPRNGTQFGTQVASVGDVDADGRSDFAVGELGLVFGTTRIAGRVTIYSGRTYQPLRTHGASTAGTRYGAALAGLGDIDGDGRPDYAIGAPSFSSPGKDKNGKVEVFSSKGVLLTTLVGAASGDEFGNAIADVGDMDKDGARDWAVGSPGRDQLPVLRDAGAVTIHSLKGRRTTWHGTATGERFGHSLAADGDTNGDGTPEIAIGSPGAFARRGSVTLRTADASGTFVSKQIGFGIADGMGSTVAFLGDLDGDGYSDLATGGSRAIGGGRVEVFAGQSGTGLKRLGLPSGLGIFVGLPAIAGVGDFDADGRDELVVGAQNAHTRPAYGVAQIYSFGVLPPRVRDVEASDQGCESVRVRWTPVGLLPHRIYRNGQFVASLPAGQRVWFDRFANTDVTYEYDVRAQNSVGLSPVSKDSGRRVRCFERYGRGCRSSRGVPASISVSRPPSVGVPFDIEVNAAPIGSIAVLMLGRSNRRWGGLVLPLRLPGPNEVCWLRTSVAATFAVGTDSTGSGRVRVRFFPEHLGRRTYQQWLVLESHASGVRVSLSDAAAFRIGEPW